MPVIIGDLQVNLDDIERIQDMAEWLVANTTYTMAELMKMTPEDVQELYCDEHVLRSVDYD